MQIIRKTNTMTLRLTKKRKEVLALLKRHKGVLCARDIHERLPHIDLATIYRNLDLFVHEGWINKMHLGSEEAQYEFQHTPHHHAVCSECERVIHFSAPDDQIKKLLKIEDFDVDRIEVTVRGICDHK